MIQLILCDDQAIVTEGLQVILGTVSDFEIVATAHDGAEAVDLVAEHRPDIVLMDLRMPIMNGIQATRQITQQFPTTRVLVLTTYDDDGWVFDAIRAGAAGYLLKDTPREQLIAAIRGTVSGATHVDPQVAGKLFQQLAQPGAAPMAGTSIGDELSEREIGCAAPLGRAASPTPRLPNGCTYPKARCKTMSATSLPSWTSPTAHKPPLLRCAMDWFRSRYPVPFTSSSLSGSSETETMPKSYGCPVKPTESGTSIFSERPYLSTSTITPISYCIRST